MLVHRTVLVSDYGAAGGMFWKINAPWLHRHCLHGGRIMIHLRHFMKGEVGCSAPSSWCGPKCRLCGLLASVYESVCLWKIKDAFMQPNAPQMDIEPSVFHLATHEC